MTTTRYYRLQGANDPLSRDWRSQWQDGQSEEIGTSCCQSEQELWAWATGAGHYEGGGGHLECQLLDLVEFEGELLGRGSDGECVVRPTRELTRCRCWVPLYGFLDNLVSLDDFLPVAPMQVR